MSDEEKVFIELTKNEALVLFDLLESFVDGGTSINPIADWVKGAENMAEVLVLNNIRCDLQTKADVVFSGDYEQYLSKAREDVLDSYFGDEEE